MRGFAISARDPEQRGRLLETKLSNITVRQLDTSLQKNDEDEDLPHMEESLRAYASALVVLRQFYERIAQGKTVLPHRVKRVAQRMVSLAESDEGALHGDDQPGQRPPRRGRARGADRDPGDRGGAAADDATATRCRSWRWRR